MHEHVELCVTSQRLSRTLKIGVSFSLMQQGGAITVQMSEMIVYICF